VPTLFLVTRADPNTVRDRLQQRTGDASDADWQIFQQAGASWEQPGPATGRVLRQINTGGSSEEAVTNALAALRALGIA
jgi:predicted kinase